MGLLSRLNSTEQKLVRQEMNLRRKIYSEGYKAGWHDRSNRPPYRSIVYRHLWIEGYQQAVSNKYG